MWGKDLQALRSRLIAVVTTLRSDINTGNARDCQAAIEDISESLLEMEESDVPANYIVRDVRRVVLGMSDTGAGPGKVVVDRVMSLDRFIAGPDHAMDWVIDYNTKYSFPEVCTPPGPGDSGRRHG